MSRKGVEIREKDESILKTFGKILQLMMDYDTDKMELTFEVNKHKVKFKVYLDSVKKLKPTKED